MSSDSLPPAHPAYILRGHSAQVHALQFTENNQRLLTGDADGWLVSWNLAFKRPVASWKAHGKAILGLGTWGQDRIISHARDNKLIVWQLGVADEDAVDKTLPVDATADASSKNPWILHILTVNTLNFCSFAMCYDGTPQTTSDDMTIRDNYEHKPIRVAVPNTVDSGGIDIYQLPSERRAAVIHADRHITTGMVMALNMFAINTRVQVAAGYESGHTMVFVQTDPGASFQRLYCAQPHSQPVLSMALSSSREYYITSSADAIIAKHPFPIGTGICDPDLKPIKISQTKHSGQQGLQIRSDGKIFSTAGWDARIRVYSAKTMNELAVLLWHKTGCYATAFSQTGAVIPARIKYESDSNLEQNELGEKAIVRQSSAATVVQQRRDEIAQTTHWLAAGSKDGKVSLWDIY